MRTQYNAKYSTEYNVQSTTTSDYQFKRANNTNQIKSSFFFIIIICLQMVKQLITGVILWIG